MDSDMMQPLAFFGVAPTLLAQEGGTFWLPPARSTIAPEVDNLFFLVLGVSVFFFALIVGLMVFSPTTPPSKCCGP